MLRTISRTTAVLLLTFSTVQCSSSADAPSTPVTPIVPPKAPPATIVLSGDTVLATLTAGAAAVTRDFEITAGNATAVAGLVASIETATSGWISATLSSETAPAKLTVMLKPTTMTAGAYDAFIRIGATGAEAKTIRASLVVKPRPRLALDKSAIAFAANLGDTVVAQTIAIASVDGAIDSLSVAKPDCGTVSPWVTPTLSASKAPATLSIKATPGSLDAGTYSCTIGISTSQALVDSATQVVRVSLSLKAVPRLVVSVDTVRTGTTRSTDAPPSFVAITNGGTGTLTGLSAGPVSYGQVANGWLTTSLDATTAPATLTLRPTAQSLSAGTYYATVTVRSSIDSVAPKTIVVAFQVTAMPSQLAIYPAQITLTKRVNAVLNQSVTATLTHTGDAPLGNIAGAPPAYWTGGGPFMVSGSLRCAVLGLPGVTPCQLTFDVTAAAGTPVGTYTQTVAFMSYGAIPYSPSAPNLMATARITLVVTP